MTELSEPQLRQFYERLLAARDAAQLLLAPQRSDAKRVETSGSTIGRLTRIDAIAVQGMEKMSRGQLSIRLQQIEAALRAFDAGRYGRCNRCKQPIDLQRLEALPEAPLCMRCQEDMEG